MTEKTISQYRNHKGIANFFWFTNAVLEPANTLEFFAKAHTCYPKAKALDSIISSQDDQISKVIFFAHFKKGLYNQA
jgi:hypothetical protein